MRQSSRSPHLHLSLEAKGESQLLITGPFVRFRELLDALRPIRKGPDDDAAPEPEEWGGHDGQS